MSFIYKNIYTLLVTFTEKTLVSIEVSTVTRGYK